MATPATHHGILVGVDGSPASKAAVDWGAREAAMRDVPLTLVHVTPSPMATMWPEVPLPPELELSFERHGSDVLREACEIAERATGSTDPIQMSSEILSGAAVSTLAELSTEAEMVVVGCRGLGAIARRLLGSVSWGLLHHARGLVAVIHGEDPSVPHPASAPVVLGVDGSPASESATAIAFDEASRRGVELVAVHAWSDNSGYAWSEATAYVFSEAEWTASRQLAEEVLAERLAGYRERYPDVPVRRVIARDQPAHQLLEHSESAQLLVLGSHGRGGFTGMLLGSVSSAVAESARVPVIVARPS